MKGEPKSASRSVSFNHVSIAFTDQSRPTKFFDNDPTVAVDKKALYFGNNANYKANWKDVEEVELGEESLKLTDSKHQRIYDCYGVSSSLEGWLAFRKMVEKLRAKREGKKIGLISPKTGTGAAFHTQRSKAPVKQRRAYGRRKQVLPSSRVTTFWPDDDDDDDDDDYGGDYGRNRGALQTREEEVNQEDEVKQENLVVALPDEEEDDGDAPALQQEEEELEDPLEIAEKKKFQTKTPVLKKLQGRNRLRKRFAADLEEDSDDDFETTADMTSPSPNQRVVTPFESTAVVEEEEQEAMEVEDTDPPTPKNQKKLHSFFSKVHKADDIEKPKSVSPTRTKTPFKKDINRIEVKKTFSSNKTSSMQSPPRRTQQRTFTPSEKYDMDLSPPPSPGDSRVGIAKRLDEPPTTSRKKKASRTFTWSSMDNNADTLETGTIERITPRKTSNTSPPNSKGKRPRLQDDNDTLLGSTNKRASIGGINRFGMMNRRLPMTTTPFRENVTASEELYKGFRNMGNTCYLNASLQMLYTTQDFVKALEGKGSDLVRSITSTAKALLDGTSNAGAASAKSVKKAMDAITDKFLGFEQRDAHEFLGDLIDNIHEEIVSTKKDVIQNDDAEPKSPSVLAKNQLEPVKESGDLTVPMDSAQVDPEPTCQDMLGPDVNDELERPPTDDYFRCDVEVCLTCNSCGYSRTKKEFYRHLSLDIEKEGMGQSVQKSLDLFFQPEEREIKCERCEEGTTASQTLRLLNRPKALLLHLKRFIFEEQRTATAPVSNSDKDKENQSDNNEAPPPQQVEIVFRKNKAPIAISENVSLKKFIGETSNKEGLYSIKSLVYHIGARASSGHYTADAIRTSAIKHDSESPDKSGSGSSDSSNTSDAVTKRDWCSFDDSRTTLTTLSEILESEQRQKTAYMLLYTLD